MLRLNNMKYDNCKLAFFTRFPNYGALEAFYRFLRPAIDALNYSCKHKEDSLGENSSKHCQP